MVARADRGAAARLYQLAIGVILVTGVILFIAEPRKLFDSAAFGPKMILLALAILFQYTLYPKVRSMQANIPHVGKAAGGAVPGALVRRRGVRASHRIRLNFRHF